MLRHLRIAPPADAARPVPRPLTLLVRNVLRPLYSYSVPHKMPRPNAPDLLCSCRYPLYTLCVPKISPYNELDTATLPPPPPPLVHSSSSHTSGVTTESNNSCKAQAQDTCAAAVAASPSSPPSNETAEEDKSSKASNKLAMPWGFWRQRSHRAYMRRYHPNVLPGRPACYRCDICDGFYKPQGNSSSHTEENATATDEAVQHGVSDTATHTSQKATSNDKGDDDEEEEGEEPSSGQPITTDLATTSMEDVDVAELRYVDPFYVQVTSKPALGALTHNFVRQYRAQLRRSGLHSRDLLRQTRRVARNSLRYVKLYESWVQQERQRGKQAAVLPEEAAARLQTAYAVLDLAAYAVRFAVAAYGLPYELGYFNSVQGLLKLQREPHCRYAWATSEEQMESMRRMLQGAEPQPLLEFALTRYSVFLNQPSFVIALDHTRRRIVLTFRGTLTMADAVVDIMDGYVEVDLAADMTQTQTSSSSSSDVPETTSSQKREDALRTRIPVGFYECVREAAAHVLPALREIHTQYADYDLLITGHSLGGVQACLFHLLYCRPLRRGATSAVGFDTVRTVTFGTPPAIEARCLPALNRLLAEEERRSGSCLRTFIYGLDPVPRLHTRAFFTCCFAHETGKVGSASNNISNSSTRCPSWTEEAMPTLALPGTLYAVPHSARHSCLATSGTDCPWLQQLVLTAEATVHHFPVHYLRAVNRLLRHKTRELRRHSCSAPAAQAVRSVLS